MHHVLHDGTISGIFSLLVAFAAGAIFHLKKHAPNVQCPRFELNAREPTTRHHAARASEPTNPSLARSTVKCLLTWKRVPEQIADGQGMPNRDTGDPSAHSGGEKATRGAGNRRTGGRLRSMYCADRAAVERSFYSA